MPGRVDRTRPLLRARWRVEEFAEYVRQLRTTHKRKKKRDGYTQDELNRVIWICAPCHKNIHASLTEKELADEYHTVAKLLAYPAIAKFTDWVRKQDDAPIRVRSSKDKQQRKKENRRAK